jgi:hypothetical protein
VDQPRFDVLTRALSSLPSRRDLLGGFAGGLAFVSWTLGITNIEAKKKRGKKKKKRRGQTAPPASPPPGPTSPPPPETVLTYQCPGPKNSLVAGNGDIRFAQTFVAERGGSLRQIQFSIGKQSGTTGDYVVQLLKVVGSKPSHNPVDVLATVTIPNAEVAAGTEVTLTAPFTGPTLVAGTEYAAAISRPGAGPAEARINTLNVGGGACGGKLFLAVAGDVFAEEILAQDLLVSVLVV